MEINCQCGFKMVRISRGLSCTQCGHHISFPTNILLDKNGDIQDVTFPEAVALLQGPVQQHLQTLYGDGWEAVCPNKDVARDLRAAIEGERVWLVIDGYLKSRNWKNTFPAGTRAYLHEGWILEVDGDYYGLTNPISQGTAHVLDGMFTLTPDPISKVANKRVKNVTGLKEGSSSVQIEFEDGTLTIGHEQQCCEHIGLADWNGEAADMANVVAIDYKTSGDDTFVEVQTTKGDLWLRFTDITQDSRYGVLVGMSYQSKR